MQNHDVEWAGVRFLSVFHHDGRFFRCPGLFAFARRNGEDRILLFVDQSDNIALATIGHPLWGDALRLGFNELHVNIRTTERIDRLLLRGHIITRCDPLLNLLGEAPEETPLREHTQQQAGRAA